MGYIPIKTSIREIDFTHSFLYHITCD